MEHCLVNRHISNNVRPKFKGNFAKKFASVKRNKNHVHSKATLNKVSLVIGLFIMQCLQLENSSVMKHNSMHFAQKAI